MKKIFLLLAVAYILMSCDPPHDIFFKNRTEHPAKVILKIKNEPETYDLAALVTGDSLVLNVSPETEQHISFGIGTWSDEEIQLVSSDIKSIVIKTNDKTVIYDNQAQIKNLLTENENGFPHTKIKIDIEE